MVTYELFHGILIGIFADGDDGDLVAQLPLQLDKRWHFFNARRTPRCPEVENDRLTAKLTERNRSLRIGDGEIGSGLTDSWRPAAIACGEQYKTGESWNQWQALHTPIIAERPELERFAHG